MQSSGLDLEQASASPRPGFIERLGWIDKTPFALGSGCLLGLSAPGFDLWWLAWIGLAPLLVLIQGCRRKLEASFVGLVFGAGYHLVAMSWLLGLYPLRWLGLGDWLGFQSAVVVWLAESLHQSLLFVGFALLLFALPLRAGFLPHYSRPYFPYLVSVPLAWVFFQWVVGTAEIFLGVPVCQLAYSQAGQLEVIQLAKLGGSQLVDMVLVSFNAALAALVVEVSGCVPRWAGRVDALSNRGGAAVDLAVVALLVAAACAWGHGELSRLAAATTLAPLTAGPGFDPHVPVAVIQGNITIEDERSGSLSPLEQCQRLAGLSHGLGAALLFLPEGVLSPEQMRPGMLLSKLRQIVTVEKKEAIAGAIEPVEDGFVNTVRLVSPRDELESFYVKRRLVPFGEFIPVGPLERLVPPAVRQLLTGQSQSFMRHRSTYLINTVWGKAGASLSAEIVYPRLIAEEVRSGASLLVNLSNLAWFHGSTLNRQMLAVAVMRSVENGRYLVLSTRTGISAVISPCGMVSSASLPGKKGRLVDTVQFLYKKTPFSKMWWL